MPYTKGVGFRVQVLGGGNYHYMERILLEYDPGVANANFTGCRTGIGHLPQWLLIA